MNKIFFDESGIGDGNHEYIIDSSDNVLNEFQVLILSNNNNSIYSIDILASLDGKDYTNETINFYGAPIKGSQSNENILLRDINKITNKYISFKIQININGSNNDVDMRGYCLERKIFDNNN